MKPQDQCCSHDCAQGRTCPRRAERRNAPSMLRRFFGWLIAERREAFDRRARVDMGGLSNIRSRCVTTAAARDVLAERRRQIAEEGHHPEHDDAHPNGEIAAYAAFYAMPPAAREWPATETGYGETWGEAIVPADWSVPKVGDRRGELVKAGALILAEIERLDRAALPASSSSAESAGGNIVIFHENSLSEK